MKLVAEPGGWTGGPTVSEAPAVAVLEVSGAVLEWTVDDPAGAATPRITITDLAAADWLWRLVGSSGHAELASRADAADVVLETEALMPLWRMAIGHWLRRWWPESRRDGIVRLDRALLDAELAILVSAAQEFFTEDTLDSDLEVLLAPHRAALSALEGDADVRIAEMALASTNLADEAGAWSADSSSPPAASAVTGRRDDYALAAGRDGDRRRGAIARGVGSVDWLAVPPGTFDAADDTIDWSVEAADSSVLATVRVALTGEALTGGIGVALRAGPVSAAGRLDVNGTAALTLVDGDGRELTETRAWDHDWSTTTVSVGRERAGTDTVAAAALRRRMREFARARLAHPGPDAFLAEVVAAESDY